jgi:DNA-binding IscR family transcriptional regulator
LPGKPPEVSAADVIRAIDGPLAMTPCASVSAFRACDDCALADLIEDGRVPALLERTPRRPART